MSNNPKSSKTLADEYHALMREITRFVEKWELKFEALNAKHERQEREQNEN